MEEAGWFLPLVNMVYMPCLDMRYGNILRFPYQPCDSVFEQPFFFVQNLHVVRSVFLDYLKEQKSKSLESLMD